jgi:hypothetical protein
LPPSDQPPAVQVLALFDLLHKRFASGNFRGCPFVNAVTELADDCETARAIAVDFKEERRRNIATLLAQASASDPDALAGQIALLFEGAIASMLVRQDPAVAIQARDAAAVLMQAAGIERPTSVAPKPGKAAAQ